MPHRRTRRRIQQVLDNLPHPPHRERFDILVSRRLFTLTHAHLRRWNPWDSIRNTLPKRVSTRYVGSLTPGLTYRVHPTRHVPELVDLRRRLPLLRLGDEHVAARMELVVDGAQAGAVDVGVDLRGGQVRVPEHLLHGPQVRPTLHQMRGEGVPQLVGRDGLEDA